MQQVPIRQARRLKGHEGSVYVCTYNSVGQYCLSGGSDRRIILWNPNTGMQIKRYEAHGYDVLDIAVTEDNSRFVSCGGDKTVFYWDVVTAQTVKRFIGHFSRVNAVALNLDGSVIASASYDASVRLWDTKSRSNSPIQILEDSKDSVSSVQIKESDIVTGSVDGRIRTYDLRMGRLVTDTIGPPITNIRQSSDDNCLLVSTLDEKIRLLDKSNGALLQTFSGHVNKEFRLRSVLGFADAYAVCGSEDGHLCLWQVLGGKLEHNIECHQGKVVTSVSVHPRGTQMISSGTDGNIVVWE